MSKIDWNMYVATSDREQGPLVTYELNSFDRVITPYTDEDGNETPGGQIGYVIAYGLMVGFFVLGWLFI